MAIGRRRVGKMHTPFQNQNLTQSDSLRVCCVGLGPPSRLHLGNSQVTLRLGHGLACAFRELDGAGSRFGELLQIFLCLISEYLPTQCLFGLHLLSQFRHGDRASKKSTPKVKLGPTIIRLETIFRRRRWLPGDGNSGRASEKSFSNTKRFNEMNGRRLPGISGTANLR